jgi:hypothetical protein
MANRTLPLAPASLIPAHPDPNLLRSPWLALDLGQQTGWALRQASGLITNGCHGFKPGRFEGGGMPLLRFAAWLEELHRSTGPIAQVYFEEVRAHKGTAAAHTYGAFLGQLAAWCEQRGIAYQGVPVGTIKKHATGQGNASKDQVMAAMRALGFDPADHNAADALALLQWALSQPGLGGRHG